MKYYFASNHDNSGYVAYDTQPIKYGEYFDEADITEPYFLIDTDDEHVSVSYRGQSPEDIYNQKKEDRMDDYAISEEELEEEAPELVSFDAWKEWIESTYVDNDSWSAVAIVETATMEPIIAGDLTLYRAHDENEDDEEFEDEEEFEEENPLEESLKEIARDLNKLVEQLKRK